MGVAAYNRASATTSRQISANKRDNAFLIMERLNALPKYPDAGMPFGRVHFIQGHGGWWATCPRTHHGYWYRKLSEAVRRWHVQITAADGNGYHAIPTTKVAP